MKNDVYRFRYSEEFIKSHKGMGDLYHCFDGILIERHPDGRNPYWEDTYWSSDNRIFRSMEEIISKGEIKLICNLDDVEPIKEHEIKYYEESDIFYLPIHKGYRGQYYNKKGSEMSKEVVLKGIENKIKELESNVEYELRKIEWLKKDILDVQSGLKELKCVSF